jgi:hypothetical protein
MVIRRALTSGVITACVFLFAASVAGAQQTVGSGAITGRVVDQSGGALPGVTVTATSRALQLPEVVEISAGDGVYRLANLPAGLYGLQSAYASGPSYGLISAILLPRLVRVGATYSF